MRTSPNLHPIPSFWEKALRRGSLCGRLPATWPCRAGANSGRDRIARERCFRQPDACLAEQNNQQARAQEHEAGRRQSKKSVGDNVVVAHDTPTTPDARPNSLKLAESPIGTTEPFRRQKSV